MVCQQKKNTGKEIRFRNVNVSNNFLPSIFVSLLSSGWELKGVGRGGKKNPTQQQRPATESFQASMFSFDKVHYIQLFFYFLWIESHFYKIRFNFTTLNVWNVSYGIVWLLEFKKPVHMLHSAHVQLKMPLRSLALKTQFTELQKKHVLQAPECVFRAQEFIIILLLLLSFNTAR